MTTPLSLHAQADAAVPDCCATPASCPAIAPVVLEIEHLYIAYGGRLALRDVTLPIRAQAITALIGPSGCGKTSFLSALNRMTDLIPGCSVRGAVRFHGVDIHARDADPVALRRRIGMIFQKPNPFPLSIRRNLELPLLERGVRDRAERESRIEQVLREAGLWDEVQDRLDTPAQALSGGQQQRLCIARALTLEPEVLLMDEPCSALDPIAGNAIEELILRLRQRYTVVIVTHNLAQARRISDHCGVFWVREGVGRLIECGESCQIFEAPGDPQTAAYVEGRRG